MEKSPQPHHLLVLAAALLLAIAVCASAVESQGRKRTMEDVLAFALAKVAANEGALINPDEPKLIWQAALSHSNNTEGRYRWLRSHSGRVLGTKPCVSGNCLWTRNLKLNPFYQPHEASHVAADYWRVVTAPRWARVMKLSADLVHGRVEEGWEPCDGKPITWGSRDPELPDEEHARATGLVALNCEGMLNDGYAAGDVVNRGER